MNYQDYLLDALERVSSWDIPDEAFADAVNDQTKLMAGINPEDTWEHPSEYPFS